MKNLQQLFLAISGTLLLSCNCADDNKPAVDTTYLATKWYYQQEIFNGKTTIFTEERCSSKFIDIQQDNYKIIEKSGCREQVLEIGTYTASATNLILIDVSGRMADFRIMYLSSNTLVLDGYFDLDADGIPDRIRLNFKK